MTEDTGKATDRAHAVYAPSASKRWMACPGCIQLSELAPPQPPNPAAIEGTDGHWLGETVLKLKSSHVDACHAFIGQKLPSGAKVTKTMATFVQKYVDYVDRHLKANGGELFVEVRLFMPKIEQNMFGSGDVIQVTKYKTLHVFDLKYGMWTIDPDKNSQMMCYAIGALGKFKDQIDMTKPVTAHICQPRPKHKDGIFRVAKYTIDELKEFGLKAKAAAHACKQVGAQLVSGEHCVFCPAEFICPELNRMGRKVF